MELYKSLENKKQILIITEEGWPEEGVKSEPIDYIFIPLKLKEKFLLSDFRVAVFMTVKQGGKIFYYE